jgi:hypothetical protein
MRAAAGALALSRARAAAERRDLPIRRRRSLLLGGEAPGYPVSICIFGEWIDRVVASEPLSGPKGRLIRAGPAPGRDAVAAWFWRQRAPGRGPKERPGPGRTPVSGFIADLWSDEAGRAARRRPSAGVHARRSAAVASGWSGPGHRQPRAGARDEGEDFADGWFLAGGFGQREVGLDLVAVAAAVFVLDDDPAAVRSVTMPWALCSVMPRLAAMSRSRVSGSWARHSRTRAWLVRKTPALHLLQTTVSRNLLLVFGCECRVRADTGISRRRRPRWPGVTGGSRPWCSRCVALSGGSCNCRTWVRRARDPGPGPAGPKRRHDKRPHVPRRLAGLNGAAGELPAA